MPHEPNPIERDELVQLVMFRLKLDELEAEQIETGCMNPAYFPLTVAHGKLLQRLQSVQCRRSRHGLRRADRQWRLTRTALRRAH